MRRRQARPSAHMWQPSERKHSRLLPAPLILFYSAIRNAGVVWVPKREKALLFQVPQQTKRVYSQALSHFRTFRQSHAHARTPALVGFRLRFASQKRAAGHRPRRGRCFGLPHFRFAQAGPLGQNPGARRLPPPFCSAKTRGRSLAPPGPACSLPRQAPLAVAPRSHPGA